jgi:O-antigen/teichoic acid export membrane protein
VNFTAGIYIEEKTKYFPLVTGIGAIVNVVVNILLIPVMGILGAALATLFAYMAMSASLFFISQKYYEIKYEYDRIIKILLLLIVSCCLYYFIYFNYEFTIIIKFAMLIGFTIALFALKIISKQELFSLTKILLRVK